MKKELLNNKLMKKVIAVLMIFNIFFVNTGMLGVQLISYAIDNLNNQDIKVSNADIEFNAFFKDNEKETHYFINDINKNANLNIYLNVKTGYLKNAKIEFLDAENKDNINYQIQADLENQNTIQQIKNNKIELQQIDNESTKVLEISINSVVKEYTKTEDLSKDSKVKLTGTYIDNKGKEKEIQKEITVNVAWTMEFETVIEERITRYISYNNKTLLQKEITVEAKNEGENKLPVEQTTLNIEVPVYNENMPEEVYVTVKDLKNTNGEENGRLTFTESNWTYNKEEKNIKINIQNKVTDQGVYSGKGKDTYIVTYVYNNVVPENVFETELKTKTIAEIKLYDGQSDKKEIANKFILTENFGEIVNYSIGITEEISKGKIYANTISQNSQHKIAYNTKWIIDIASIEEVETLKAQDMGDKFVSLENRYNVNTLYKQTKINKNNFEQILGTEGNIKVSNLTGEEIANINKDAQQDKNGNFVLTYTQDINQIVIETSVPIKIGNLIIEHEKEIQPVQYINKEQIQSLINITSSIMGQIKYANKEEITNTTERAVEMVLKETATQAKICVEPENLSTIVKNENVVFKIQLNDESEVSDLYKNPVFDIYLPTSVETIEIKEANILYNEEITISKVENFQVEDRNVIRITLSGESTKFSIGTIARGTNIMLKANVTLKKLTPNKTELVEMSYINENAVQYIDFQNGQGYASTNVELVAPTGLVNISTITNFDQQGSSITSINQGEKIATINILENAKSATMTLTVMNNNPNTCSNITLIGKIPFKGNTDLKTGEELGTTVDTILTSSITSLNIPAENITIYYSEKSNVDQNLNNEQNEWTTTPADLSRIKSYLITLNNYELQAREIVEFTYNFEIPEKLEHNNYIFGTFGTLYQNNTELATINELAITDKVGLTTGTGPEIDFKLTSNVENGSSIMQFQNIKYKMIVKNKGNEIAENIVSKFNIADEIKYVKTYNEEEKYQLSSNKKELIWTIDSLAAGETKEFEFEVTALTVTENNIENKATLTAKDLGTEMQSEIVTYKIKESPFMITVSADYNEKYKLKEDISMNFYATIRNNTEAVQNNVVIKTYIPEGLIYVKGYKLEYDSETQENNYVELNAQYDKATRILTYTRDKLEVMENVSLKLEVLTEYITGEDIKKEIITKISAQADGIELVYSNELSNIIARAKLDINQTSSVTNKFLKEGDSLNYIITVTNNGYMSATKINIEGQIPEELEIQNITYTSLGTIRNAKKPTDNTINFTIGTIGEGETSEIVIETKAKRLAKGLTEANIANTITIGAENIAKKQTNTVSHTIEINEALIEETPQVEEELPTVKTYKINGLAWLDKNKNGTRDIDETLVNNLQVSLVNENKQIISKTNTDEKGIYEFTNLTKGNYFVMFNYDTKLFKTTEYQKDGIKDDVNSDAFEAQIKQNNQLITMAITDVIKITDVSYSNIDLGLVDTEHFNLSLNKVITSMILQNSGGTTTYDYDNLNLAKMEIAGKKLVGSTVIIEYKILISNKGTIAGTVNNVVDYLPNGMEFSSELNPNWYLGQDNNLYNQSLKETIINPGETKEIKLILTKKMTENNTGIVNNNAEIYEAYNEKGLKDVNSTPANKVQSEDDMGSADAMISVRTGEVTLYISLVFVTAAIIGLGLGLTQKSISKKQWEGIE